MYSNDLPDMSEALRQVYEKNDGNLANNAPPYDKVTRRDVITGRLGKDEMGGKRKKHDCAKKVNYKADGSSVAEEFDVIPEQHTMLEDGTVTHYDITNGEYIYENVPVEELEILISEKHEHFDNYDKNAEVLGEGEKNIRGYDSEEQKKRLEKKRGMKLDDHPQYKKEAFAFSEEDFEELEQFSEEIDAMSDVELIDMMEDLILEMAEDDQDLIEICEHLEEVEILSEDYYASAVKASKEASKKPEVKAANRRARVERLKKAAGAAAKKVGSAAKAAAAKAKPVAKAAAKGAVRGAGYAAGVAQRAASSAKSEFKKGRERGLKGSGSSKPASSSSSSSSSSDDDGTDGKLDSVLSSIRGSKGTSSGGGSSSASSGGGGKKKPGLLRRVAGAVGRGLKKAAGKTARAVSSGSDKLAKRLGENYDQIAHLYESGLFTIEEIENVIEEGYKPYPAEKVARKREAVKKKEDIANYQRRDDDANKLYKRGVAMSFKKKMKDVGGN